MCNLFSIYIFINDELSSSMITTAEISDTYYCYVQEYLIKYTYTLVSYRIYSLKKLSLVLIL